MAVKDHSITGEIFELWRCDGCDFLFTQDPPSEENAGRYYKGEEYISHSDNQEGVVNKLYHKARDFMLGQKYKLVDQFSRGKRLLDYGTGTGYFTDFMVRKGYQAQGIEIDPDAREYGSKKFGITVNSPEYLFNGLKPNSFDAITMWHVLEHLYDPAKYLKQFYELLSDEGILVIAVPNHKSRDAGVFGPDWAAYDVPRHLWHFGPNTMRKMVGNAGFRVTETRHMPLDPFYVSIMSQKYANGGGGLVSGGIKGLQSFATSFGEAELGSSVIYVCVKGGRNM
jgi:2-polyprenyl-3-methyl-5-hydroxy-6-metoxy-1,4-benzoquinol methylase